MMKLGTFLSYEKKIQKIYESILEFCWHQHFFNRNEQILLYQEIKIYIGLWRIISNSFNFVLVFKDCFDKDGHNFDHVSKSSYSRPS